ncbi:MAG: hypothetical protein LBN04_09820 [Oscillospiraceae bacterium]|jgi:hypothetical protein|nr:hypothetical protein [Oscillospiraceae bacterium]
MPLYAYLTQLHTLDVLADTIVPFTGPALYSEDVTLPADGQISLPRAGVFKVEYKVNIPSGAVAQNLGFVVQVDGENVAGTETHMNLTQPISRNTAMGTMMGAQAIFEVNGPAIVTLVALHDAHLTMPSENDAVASITLTEL